MRYKCVVADPPWEVATTGKKASPEYKYKLMSVKELCNLQVPADEEAHLYLWVVNQYVDWGYEVARAWGFAPVQMVTWCKRGPGTGRFQCNSESFLVCQKGNLSFGKGIKNYEACIPGTWYEWPRGRHSEKPQAMYDLVHKISPGPYLEMFGRKLRPGRDVWGNEVEGQVVIESAGLRQKELW